MEKIQTAIELYGTLFPCIVVHRPPDDNIYMQEIETFPYDIVPSIIITANDVDESVENRSHETMNYN